MTWGSSSHPGLFGTLEKYLSTAAAPVEQTVSDYWQNPGKLLSHMPSMYYFQNPGKFFADVISIPSTYPHVTAAAAALTVLGGAAFYIGKKRGWKPLSFQLGKGSVKAELETFLGGVEIGAAFRLGAKPAEPHSQIEQAKAVMALLGLTAPNGAEQGEKRGSLKFG